jgi:hypothetical protein
MKIEMNDSTFVVNLSAWDRLLCFKFTDIHIPFEVVESVECNPEFLNNWWIGMRVGTGIPNVVLKGYLYHQNEKPSFVFYNYNKESTISISIKQESDFPYSKLILELPSKDEANNMLKLIQEKVKNSENVN